MVRELKDIELHEISLVDKAANKKKFLFFKQEDTAATKTKPKKLKKKLNIIIDSDGTVGGTKITLNKEEIKDLRDFSFSFWSGEDITRAVSCSYSKIVETDDGFSRSETFYLSKGDLKMDDKIQKKLKDYFNENEETNFEKAEENDAIVKSLETVNEYKEDFPDDLKKAVSIIVKQVGFCDIIVSKMSEKKNSTDTDNKTELEKAGAKLSKETLTKITNALDALKSIIPALKESTEKSDKTEVEKTIEELQKKLTEFEEKKEDDVTEKLTKTLIELADRLATVEKGTGVKKGLKGQDNDNDNDDEGTKWPSFNQPG